MSDYIFLKVMPKRGVVKFGKQGKLSPRYIRAFEVLEKGWYGCILVGLTTKLIKCACRIPCLHAQEVHLGSDSYGGLGRACS